MASRKMSPRGGSAQGGRTLIEAAIVSLAAAFLPLLALIVTSRSPTAQPAGTWNSQVACLIAAMTAFLIHRRVTAYPGTRAFAYLLPSYSSTFGLATVVLLVTRIGYSGAMLLTGYAASLTVGFALGYLRERSSASLRMYYVPTGNVGIVADAPQVDWVRLERPQVPADYAPIIADLRSSHASEWERMLAEAAISGRAVYHTKQLRESLTGRVEIEHLSENSFGSLVPNLTYRGFKRAVDVLGCLILLPILFVPLLGVALVIKLDSSGPIFFRQVRMGYQGVAFRVIKFRTMTTGPAAGSADGTNDHLITKSNDARITAFGRFLRRSRIDELPQLINVLRGEMSWIGPRPEAVSLSEWYARELPFYGYRHIVRPGITGWAQVNQGHVAGLDEVHQKLHYDFYYIKYFSAWLDILIAMRTVGIMVSGFGSK